MKILFDHPNPFFLAHGGFQLQIEQTRSALIKSNVQVEYLRWWDDQQTGDIIHFFGRPNGHYINFAHTKKIRVVMSELLTGIGSRSSIGIFTEKLLIKLAKKTISKSFINRFAWDSYQKADALVALTSWEAHLMNSIFEAPTKNLHVVPNGVEDIFFQDSSDTSKEDYLICPATIVKRKRTLELAHAAIMANIPIWFIGKPYNESDEYYLAFIKLHKKYPSLIRYKGALSDRRVLAQAYRKAKGFVLLSSMESLSLSALEAAACRCPLLLSDLPWARYTFKKEAYYVPVTTIKKTAMHLHNFYHQKQYVLPPIPSNWLEIANKLMSVYHSILD